MKREQLESLCKILAEGCGKQWGSYRKNEDGTFSPVIGAWDLSEQYGGCFALEEIDNDGGGVHQVIQTLPRRDFEHRVRGAIDILRVIQKA